MGGCVSSSERQCVTAMQPQKLDTLTHEVMVDGNPIIPLDVVTRLTEIGRQSLCKIDVVGGLSSGFLGSVEIGECVLKGFFTNNHVVSGSVNLRNVELIFEHLGVNHKLKEEDVDYFFTCDLLDTTFIKLNHKVVNRLINKGARFISITMPPPPPSELPRACPPNTPCCHLVCVVQHPKGGSASLSLGRVNEFWGFDVRHSASTLMGSSGSPLLNANYEVIGLHKGSHKNDYNLATNFRYIICAIEKDYPHYTGLPPRVATPLQPTDLEYLSNLVNLVCEDDHNCSFISPAFFIISAIWFRRTHHHWFWTPTDPTKRDANWMQISPADSKRVIGNGFAIAVLAPKNVKIIEYLQRHGDSYCF